MSRLTVISSASMLDSQITDSFATLENLKLFGNAVTANFLLTVLWVQASIYPKKNVPNAVLL